MARIQWHGHTFTAKPIKELPDGGWLMEAQEHGARFTIGTKIKVQKREIIELASAEMPPSPDAGLAQLEAAMAEERKTLPTPAEIIANWRANKSATPEDQTQMPSKLSSLPGLVKSTAQEIEDQADKVASRLQNAKTGAGVALDKLNTVAADVEKSTAQIEDTVNQLTNGAPPLGE